MTTREELARLINPDAEAKHERQQTQGFVSEWYQAKDAADRVITAGWRPPPSDDVIGKARRRIDTTRNRYPRMLDEAPSDEISRDLADAGLLATSACPCRGTGDCVTCHGVGNTEAYDCPAGCRGGRCRECTPVQQDTDVSGSGWYEVIHPSRATTHVAYVYEDGSIYFPEGEQLLDRHEFAFAAARGNVHRLVRAACACGCDMATIDGADCTLPDGHDGDCR